MSDMHMKAYVDARTEFEALAGFPQFSFYEEAQFRIGLSVYRQCTLQAGTRQNKGGKFVCCGIF